MGTLTNSKGHHDLVVDETSCGPMCQHPSCWASNQRLEKGFPLKRELEESPREDDLELPSLKVYNMLDDYGDDTRDRFPAKQSGRQAHDWARSSLPALPKSASQPSFKKPDTMPALASKSHESLEVSKRSRTKVVEVQEVFDVEDLNNKWDETFITRKYYVWVPNQNKPHAKPKTLDPLQTTSANKLASHPQPIPPKDMTEQLVPEELERQREEARVFDDFPVLKKKYSGANGGISRGNLYSRGTTHRSARPYVDSESLQELLDLPRDILLSVLQHMGDSDLASADKVHKVVKQIQTPPDRCTPRSVSPRTSDLLKQKKVKLLGNKEKNQRNPDLLMTKPVFQLDSGASPLPERSIVVHTPVHEPVKELVKEEVKDKVQEVPSRAESGKEDDSTRELSKYKKPLPGIAASAVSRSDGSAKLASISLGLPELPSGLRQTRPFTYKKQQFIDFSLGPVPTPPVTDRSSEADGSDHGTTLRVNIPSASTRVIDRDVYARYSRDGTPMTDTSVPLHNISPSTSAKLPKTPLGTPATRSSPTKMSFHRDKTGGQASSKSPPPSRDISMSPVQKVIAPANSPNQSPGASPEPGTRGLITIPEMNDDGSIRNMPYGKIVSFECEVPPPPPASLDEHHTYTITLNQDKPPSETHTVSKGDRNTNSVSVRRADSGARLQQSPESSNEEWPNISEEAYNATSEPQSPEKKSRSEVSRSEVSDQLRLDSAERSSKTPASRGRSTVGSRESVKSDKSSVAKLILEDNVKPESPGPPPPSPEPKDWKKVADEKKRQEVISGESQSMAPLYEENETGDLHDHDKNIDFDRGVMTTVSQVTPQPKSGKREISVQTFVNVDIQADEEETGRKSTAKSGETSGNLTGRTYTGNDHSNGFESPQDLVLNSPVQVAEDDKRTPPGLSRETTGLRGDIEPESVSGNINIEAVNYEDQGTDRSKSLTLAGSENTDMQPSEREEAEMEQESVSIPAEDIKADDGRTETEETSQTPKRQDDAADADASPKTDARVKNERAEEKEDDKQHKSGAENTNNNAADDSGEVASTLTKPQKVSTESEKPSGNSGPLDVNEEPTAFSATSEDERAEEEEEVEGGDGYGSAVDVNIPPPVSRTNTAIEMVRSVIENATAKMEDIVSSGESPDSNQNPETQ